MIAEIQALGLRVLMGWSLVLHPCLPTIVHPKGNGQENRSYCRV